MTILINEQDTSKFQRKMDSAIEKLYEKYGEAYPEAEYTYEETEMPSRVIASEDTDNLVSLMYTAFNGVYHRSDEGNIIALTNIGRLSTKNSRLNIDVAVMCSDPLMLEEISETYETICGLCDVSFKIKEEIPVYNGLENDSAVELLSSFETAFLEFSGEETMIKEDTAVLTNCSFIHEAVPETPVIFCGITSKTKYKIAGSIITWLNQADAAEKNG